jgi:hypothetical protein
MSWCACYARCAWMNWCVKLNLAECAANLPGQWILMTCVLSSVEIRPTCGYIPCLPQEPSHALPRRPPL